jgi:hypothetical protein
VSTLEEQFGRRKLPTQVVLLPADPDEYGRISRELAEARWVLEEARVRAAFDTGAERAEVARLEDALEELEVVRVTLSALPAPEWEALVAAHPPTPEKLAEGHQWDIATFRPALLSAAVIAAGDRAPDWDLLAKQGKITAGELNTLFDAAVMLNMRGLSVAVGKGR